MEAERARAAWLVATEELQVTYGDSDSEDDSEPRSRSQSENDERDAKNAADETTDNSADDRALSKRMPKRPLSPLRPSKILLLWRKANTARSPTMMGATRLLAPNMTNSMKSISAKRGIEIGPYRYCQYGQLFWEHIGKRGYPKRSISELILFKKNERAKTRTRVLHASG